ncbi:MAG: ABC transporter ATP-binding protein [Clostridia bacterium]|nr:ABC transporter ATP-binding protein [Clostridia bacterium]
MNRRPGGPGAMGRAIEKPKNTSEVVARLLGYFKNEKKLLLPLILIVIAVTVSMLFAPSMQGDAIDYITEKKWNSLYFVLGSMMALYIFQSVCTLFQTLLSAHLSQRIVRKMRHQLFKKIINLPIKYIDTHSNGDIMSRLTNDVENISNTISMSLGSLVSGVLTIVGTITIMLFKCWQLTLITLLTVVMTVFVTQNLSKVMRKIYKRRSVALGKLNGHSEEMITGYKTIASYNREKQVTDEFNKLSDDLCNVSMRAEVLGGSMGPIMNCISNISFVIVAAFGGYFALSGIISIGTISAFIIYSKQFSRPINEIAMLYGSLQTALAGAERVFELIDNPDETDGGQNTLENIKGEVSFKNVDFSYIPGKQVLHDFSLDVKPGQKIALVGATGSGKTTVVNLLMRFYNTDSGEILIDGVNINDIQMDELRKNIAIVLQDTVLFSDTIGNNIKYSDMNASDDIMYDAASMSNSAYFIERLPDGYNTFLTQAGANISQGQRQLLAIARAILADPKILILDEATSSVDTRTEKHIQNAMVKLMENRTSLIIAHRLSTIRDSDKIVVMDNGRVVETGTHDQLLELKEKYYRLYITQFAGNEI